MFINHLEGHPALESLKMLGLNRMALLVVVGIKSRVDVIEKALSASPYVKELT